MMDKEENSSERLTLEKLRLNERVHDVEIQIARLLSFIESEKGTWIRFQDRQTEIFEQMKLMHERHERILTGDNGSGLLMRIDRIEQIEESRKWHLRMLWGTSAGLLLKSALDFLKKR